MKKVKIEGVKILVEEGVAEVALLEEILPHKMEVDMLGVVLLRLVEVEALEVEEGDIGKASVQA